MHPGTTKKMLRAATANQPITLEKRILCRRQQCKVEEQRGRKGGTSRQASKLGQWGYPPNWVNWSPSYVISDCLTKHEETETKYRSRTFQSTNYPSSLVFYTNNRLNIQMERRQESRAILTTFYCAAHAKTSGDTWRLIVTVLVWSKNDVSPALLHRGAPSGRGK